MSDQSYATITVSAYEQVIRLCNDCIPLEACGILASSTSLSFEHSSSNSKDDKHVYLTIDTIIPIRNIHASPENSFAFDPEEWTAAYYDMQKNRQTLVGLFHSHPRTDAVPSIPDKTGFLPASNLTYWIISLKDTHAPHVQPYKQVNGIFEPLKLVLA